MSWWLTPPSQTGRSRFTELAFDVQSLARSATPSSRSPWVSFAGTIWHKVLPAMAGTLAGFLGLRIALAVIARHRCVPAETRPFSIQDTALQPNAYGGDWISPWAR